MPLLLICLPPFLVSILPVAFRGHRPRSQDGPCVQLVRYAVSSRQSVNRLQLLERRRLSGHRQLLQCRSSDRRQLQGHRGFSNSHLVDSVRRWSLVQTLIARLSLLLRPLTRRLLVALSRFTLSPRMPLVPGQTSPSMPFVPVQAGPRIPLVQSQFSSSLKLRSLVHPLIVRVSLVPKPLAHRLPVGLSRSTLSPRMPLVQNPASPVVLHQRQPSNRHQLLSDCELFNGPRFQ